MYLIADTHFGHENIIKYEERPFGNVEEMDRALIENWNNVVSKNSKVFHLGDVFLTHTERQFEIFNQLNGEITLIRGNHDSQSYHKLINRIGFKAVHDKYWLSDKVVLTHRPMEVNDDMLNIHGHIHGLFYKNSKWKDKNHFCASVELINYEPIHLAKIIEEVL